MKSRFGPSSQVGSGIYLMRFPDHYKIGMSDWLRSRIATHRHAGGELVSWVAVPSDKAATVEEGLIAQIHAFLHDGLEASERFPLTDQQVAKVQHRQARGPSRRLCNPRPDH